MKLKTYGIPMRIWHWLNAVAILGLLATVVLRKTFLSYKTNAGIIQSELAKVNLEITADAAKVVAKAIRAPMWEWHYVFGFLLAGLLVYRIILHFTERPLLSLVETKNLTGKHKLIEYLYLIQYTLILVMALSGLTMYFKEALSIPKESITILKEAHEIIMYFFAFFVPMHILGIFVAENTDKDKKGIVSNMIGGTEF